MGISIKLVCCAVMIASLYVETTVASLKFDLRELNQSNQNIDMRIEGVGTFISDLGMQLVRTNTSTPTNRVRAGRGTYVKPFHLWDAESGKLADFTTTFSVIVYSEEKDSYGDGLTFFLAENESLFTDSSGAMGLSVLNGRMATPFVAVELDTYWNNWDPVDEKGAAIGDHIGVNVNSIVSVKFKKWNRNAHEDRKEFVVKIRYDSASRNLSVDLGEVRMVDHTVDLRNELPEWVVIGFSASSSGHHWQTNIIKSWSFNGTDLHSNKKNMFIITIRSLCASAMLSIIVGLLVYLLLDKYVRQRSPSPSIEKTKTQTKDNGNGNGNGKGDLRTRILPDGKKAAVKQLFITSCERKVYHAEVTTISSVTHRNLVKIFSWWFEKKNKQFFVAYEFMENGSLEKHLFDKETAPLPWSVRFNIAHGLAVALRYLHEESGLSIMHKNVKSSNVLLDSNFNAKLGDYGFSKLEECKLHTRESDVYGYGVVALEIATGSKDVEENPKVFVKWLKNLRDHNKILQAADPRLEGCYNKTQMEVLMLLGLQCVGDLRPPSADRIATVIDKVRHKR